MFDRAREQDIDCAVIMARGQSLRMGFPKGEAVLPGSGQSLLTVVEQLYRDLDFQRMIVTLPKLLPHYQTLVEAEKGLHWVTDGPGGDTARTLLVAWQKLRLWPVRPKRIWAHPVDLPLVQDSTLIQLGQESDQYSDCVIRPAWKSKPGHPVIFPTRILDRIFDGISDQNLDGPMRDLLGRVNCLSDSGGVRELSVGDEGVIKDFDDPAALS